MTEHQHCAPSCRLAPPVQMSWFALHLCSHQQEVVDWAISSIAKGAAGGLAVRQSPQFGTRLARNCPQIKRHSDYLEKDDLTWALNLFFSVAFFFSWSSSSSASHLPSSLGPILSSSS